MSFTKPILQGPVLTKLPPHPSSTPHAALMPLGHLDPARETKRDNGHGQGAQTCPHHGPWRAGRLSYCHRTQPPTHRGTEPTAPCQPCPLECRADLSGAHRRSLWRDFGSEKLWMRKDRAVSHLWGLCLIPREPSLHCSPAVATGSSFGSCSIQDGTRLAPLPRPAWLPGSYPLPRPQGNSLGPAPRMEW